MPSVFEAMEGSDCAWAVGASPMSKKARRILKQVCFMMGKYSWVMDGLGGKIREFLLGRMVGSRDLLGTGAGKPSFWVDFPEDGYRKYPHYGMFYGLLPNQIRLKSCDRFEPGRSVTTRYILCLCPNLQDTGTNVTMSIYIVAVMEIRGLARFS